MAIAIKEDNEFDSRSKRSLLQPERKNLNTSEEKKQEGFIGNGQYMSSSMCK